MICIEICYDHKSFNCARTAVIFVPEQEGVTYINEYFESARKKLLDYVYKKYNINEDEIRMHNWKYHGDSTDVIE